MRRALERLTNKLGILLLAIMFLSSTLAGCTYKLYHFKGKSRVIGNYLARYMSPNRYLVIYTQTSTYHLANHKLNHDTLSGNFESLDEIYLPYLITDTSDLHYKALEKRYSPAEAVHIFTRMNPYTVGNEIKIPVTSISSIKVYHWKMTTLGKLCIIIPIGVIFLTAIFIGAYSMRDFSVY